MKKAARIWRLQAQKGRHNKLKNAGIILFGVVGENKIAGNREDRPPLMPKFKNDIGAYTHVVDVAYGDDFVIVCTATGQVFFQGQDPLHLQEPTDQWLQVPALPGGGGQRVAAGLNHIVVINPHGHVLTWGNGSYGQLGHGDYHNEANPKLIKHFVENSITIIDIICHKNCSVALSDKGIVYVWGELMNDASMAEKSLDNTETVGGIFVHSNKPVVLPWGTPVDASRGPRLFKNNNTFGIYYPHVAKAENDRRGRSRSGSNESRSSSKSPARTPIGKKLSRSNLKAGLNSEMSDDIADGGM